jgi:imidazolonepropionase-like amidohydrolase
MSFGNRSVKNVIAIWALAASLVLAAQERPQLLVIDHVTIVDGTSVNPPIRNGAIVVEGQRIQQVGPRGNIRSGPGITILDANGKWAIPGLIDAHVHFDQSGDIFTRPDAVDLRKQRSYAAEVDWIRQRLPVTLMRYPASGVTSVVDMGGPMWRFDIRELAANTANAPRVALAGPLISTYSSPGLETGDPAVILAKSPDHARELVRAQLSRKPDLIKILFIHTKTDDLDKQAAIVEAAIDESRKNHVRTAVHATELETAKIALQAGADILVHSITDRVVDTGFIDLIKGHNALYITTLMVDEKYDQVFRQAVNLTDIERRLGDPQVIDSWKELSRISPAEIPGGIPDIPIQTVRKNAFTNLQLLESAGVRIVAGTDAGNIGTLHGPALHREFELMAEAGMRPTEILIAATKNAAAVMGKEAELGTLERGKLADLLLLDADPTRDIHNARKIYKVMKNGAFIDIPADALK